MLQYLLVGAGAGLAAGMLGVGGGLIIVPFLVWTLAAQGIALDIAAPVAIGTSLATIVLTSISSLSAHHRRGAVRWLELRALLPGIVAGVVAGAIIADWLPGQQLKRVFGVFELLVAAVMLGGLRPSAHRGLPGKLGMSVAGAIIGCVSAIVGIGGGTMTVPFLTWCNVAMREAVGTAAAAGLPIAIAGALAFMVTGLDEAALPPYSTGFVYWPAFAGIVVASVAVAPLGAWLAHSLPTAVLKRVFGAFLAVLGARMLDIL